MLARSKLHRLVAAHLTCVSLLEKENEGWGTWWDTSEISSGWQEIPKRPRKAAFASRLDFAWPSNYAGTPNTSFIQTSLEPSDDIIVTILSYLYNWLNSLPERAWRIEEKIVMTALIVSAIIRSKEHNSILIHIQFMQQCKKRPNILILLR